MDLHAEDLVLVGVVPRASDLEIARVLGWYRIPVRRAPKMVSVDWLALYQTARCAGGRAGIYSIAPVLGHELATRAQLFHDQPDHPHVGDAYYKLQLGPMLSLPRPIVDGAWSRLTFLYTTGGRLLTAHSFRQLKISAPADRQALWRALRERAAAYAVRPQTGRSSDAGILALLRRVAAGLERP